MERLDTTLEGHVAPVTSAEFSPHGLPSTLVSVSEDRTFKVSGRHCPVNLTVVIHHFLWVWNFLWWSQLQFKDIIMLENILKVNNFKQACGLIIYNMHVRCWLLWTRLLRFRVWTKEQLTNCATNVYMSLHGLWLVFRHFVWCIAALYTCKEDCHIDYSLVCTAAVHQMRSWNTHSRSRDDMGTLVPQSGLFLQNK